MNTGLILHTFLGLLLLLIPAGALYLLEQKMLRSFFVAVGRMVVQLLVLCLVVWLLFKVDHVGLLLGWLLLVVVVSARLVLMRCRLKDIRLWPAVGAGLLVSVAFVGLWLLGLVMPGSMFDPRWFVPVMAILLDHSAAMSIRSLNTYLTALKTDEQQYEFLRGNGASHLKAVMPFVRRAFQAVTAPTEANLSTMALMTMPLLLCGLLLGGVQPVDAFVVTLTMTVGCVAASVIALISTLWLADRQLFDKFGKLR